MIQGGKITKQKIAIAEKIRPIMEDQAIKDLENLININPTKKDLNRIIGNRFIDYYMFPYRLDVNTYKHNSNFYEFYKSPSSYLGEKGLKYYKEFIKTNSPFDFYTLYISSVSIFKPLLSKYIYKLFNPSCVLDPTMGWGGRMVGAMVLPDIKYIGFDTNQDLIKPYKKMVKDLKISKRVKLIFKDSSKADLSKFNYDMVFTSPPYYKKNKVLEQYENMPEYNDKEDWYDKFFYPVFSNAYKHMKVGGKFCINTNNEGYDMLKRFLGKCDKKINIKNTKAQRYRVEGEFKNDSKEYIYIWFK
jgi:tRNA G10  N-methylase Trm11